jgi:hypothetical protein
MENAEQIIADLKKNMDAMLELQRKAMELIPNEHNGTKEKIIKDLSSIPKHVENADFTSINQLLSHYASNNSK